MEVDQTLENHGRRLKLSMFVASTNCLLIFIFSSEMEAKYLVWIYERYIEEFKMDGGIDEPKFTSTLLPTSILFSSW